MSLFMGNTLIKAAVVDFSIQWVCWIAAAAFQTEKFYDVTGSFTFIALTLLSLNENKIPSTRQKVNSGLVVTWASRLGVYLFTRILADGHDRRFDRVRNNPKLFFWFWTVQGIWVFLSFLPTLIINSKKDNARLKKRDYVGWGLWGLGFLTEMVADFQKSQFRSNPENAGRFITSGLWSISRHPNYFGEILMWFGLFLSASSGLRGWEYISIISPAFVTFLLVRVSGLPLLESAGLKRWGRDPDYRAYLQNTAALVPYVW